MLNQTGRVPACAAFRDAVAAPPAAFVFAFGFDFAWLAGSGTAAGTATSAVPTGQSGAGVR
ncbi:hypothetical protein [Streptomyces sp. NPDC014006]|uniref:hypothetical protein n=1 Tax=Streptomyces sp. NPDC014006 TaxID=3364870 RepID=UPI0036FF571B